MITDAHGHLAYDYVLGMENTGETLLSHRRLHRAAFYQPVLSGGRLRCT